MNIARGELISFAPATWTATVRLWTSLASVIPSIPVAHNIPREQLVASAQVAVAMFDANNPLDSVIIAVYQSTPADEVAAVGDLHAAVTLHANAQVALSLSTQDISVTSPTELTIASGEITVTRWRHLVDTESDAASDDLDTINGGLYNGQPLWFKPASGARTVIVKHGTGNIWNINNADVTLDDWGDSVHPHYYSGWWLL